MAHHLSSQQLTMSINYLSLDLKTARSASSPRTTESEHTLRNRSVRLHIRCNVCQCLVKPSHERNPSHQPASIRTVSFHAARPGPPHAYCNQPTRPPDPPPSPAWPTATSAPPPPSRPLSAAAWQPQPKLSSLLERSCPTAAQPSIPKGLPPAPQHRAPAGALPTRVRYSTASSELDSVSRSTP